MEAFTRDISGHNCDEFAGFSFAVDSMWTRTLFPGTLANSRVIRRIRVRMLQF